MSLSCCRRRGHPTNPDSVQERKARRQSKAGLRVACKHCDRDTYPRPFGLCTTCYEKPWLRDQYRTNHNHNRRGLNYDFMGQLPLDATPTDAPAGSVAKILVLMRRAEAGLALFHPLDTQLQR